MGQLWIARLALGTTAALAAVSVAVAITQPSADATGAAVGTTIPAAPLVVATTTTLLVPDPTTTSVPPPPTTAVPAPTPVVTAPRVTAPATPTTAAVVRASGGRESCGWSWDATHFDDGSLNEVTLLLEAPRRPNSPVTMTAKPSASPLTSFATTTDPEGYASMTVALSNDKRDWTLTIGAQFPGSSCDARSFTISY